MEWSSFGYRLGEGEKRERDGRRPWIPLLLSACYLDGIANTLFYRGSSLDLIKVSLGYAAMFEVNVYHGPFRSRAIALKKETLLYIGGNHPYSVRCHRGTDIFCIKLLLNWAFVSKKTFYHSMVCIYNNLFLKKFARRHRSKALLLVQNIFISIPSGWCNIFLIALMLCLILGSSTCF